MYSQASLGNILIVDNNESTADFLRLNLKSEGYSVDIEPSTANVDSERLGNTHIVIVDGSGQQPDGCELIRSIRQSPEGASTGIIFCSDFDSERTLVSALDAGADDCIRKPFSLRETLARVRAIMRRRHREAPPQPSDGIIRFKELEVNVRKHSATLNGADIKLSNTEFAILRLLLRNKAAYTSRVAIFKAIWPDNNGANERIVDTNISRLRRKLGPLGPSIVNRSGLGYILAE